MYKEVKYKPCGDKSILVEFGYVISPEINSKIRSFVSGIESNKIEGIEELVPTYRSVLVSYNPLLVNYDELLSYLKDREKQSNELVDEKIRIFEIPTVYGGEYGPDIEFVANHNNLSIEEVIEIHTSTPYLIYMLGFTPGFTYLGGMSEKIETPRLETPRTKIPAGSTGIAGNQTGIYPIDSPGGWQLIGRTPVNLYNPYSEPPVLLNAGDYVQFKKIEESEYLEIKNQVDKGEYKINIR